MVVSRCQVEFLTLLAFTQIECGRYADALSLLQAVQILDDSNIDASRLLALAQLRNGDAEGCLQTIDRHEDRFGANDKQRQMVWMRIRALHASGQSEFSRRLLAKLRADISLEQNSMQIT